VARKLSGVGTYLSVRHGGATGFYPSARFGATGFVLGSDSAAGRFQPRVCGRVAAGIFLELPKELFEAAFVDGCSYTGMFWRITMPLSLPILATVGVLALVGSWNEYLLPLVMINDQALYPWPLGIMQYQGQYGTDWGKVLAFVSLTLAPAVIFYLMAQKYIIAGLTSGAVKG
jgi:raffinose/stachyose/melibiose transport system permease protein